MEGFTPFPEDLAKQYLEKGYWPNRTLGEFFDETVHRFQDKEAVVDEGIRITFTQLSQKVDNLIAGLLDLGIEKGDRILVQLPNWYEFICIYIALGKIGAVPVMALPAHRAREIEYLMGLTDSAAIFAPGQFKDFHYSQMIREIKPNLQNLRFPIIVREEVPKDMINYADLLEKGKNISAVPLKSPNPTDPLLILLTGGTTAFPKAIPRTHNDYLCNTTYTAKAMGITQDAIYLVTTPVAHNAAIICALNNMIMLGIKLVLTTATKAEEIFMLTEKEKITHAFVVPAQMVNWLNSPDRKKYDLSSLGRVVVGGQKAPPEVVKRWIKENSHVSNIFGMAEGPCICTKPEDPERVVAETVGRPACPGDEFKIMEAGKELPRGQAGELFARGPYTFRGYYKAEDYNREVFTQDGFLGTGDILAIDEEGNFRVMGRKKDMIIRAGENISPEEIENLIITHPNVENVAVIGMPDEIVGERVCAYIVLKPGATLTFEEMIHFLMDKRIAKFKLPERIEFVPDLPRTNVGKIDKKALRQMSSLSS